MTNKTTCHAIVRILIGLPVVCLVLTISRPAWAEESTKDAHLIASLNIKRMALGDLTRLLSRGCGRNIVVSDDAAKKPVTIYLRNVTVTDAVRAICDANKLWYKEREPSGLLMIVTMEEYKAGLGAFAQDSLKVITLRYLDTRDAGDALKRLFRDRVAWTRPDDDEGDSTEMMERALERMDLMARRGETANDRATSGSESGNYRSGDYRFTNAEREFRRLAGSGRTTTSQAETAWRQERTQPEDRFTEAELLAAREALQAAGARPDERLGGRPGVVYLSSVAGTNRLALRSSDPKAIEEVAAVVQELDKPKPQVLLEVKVLNLRLDDDERYGIQWLFQSGDVSGGFSTGINSGTLGSEFGQIQRPGADLAPRGAGLDPRGMVLSVVTDNIAARLQLLMDKGRVTSLATPNLCVADNEASRVFIGDEITVLTDLEVRSQFNETGNLVRTDINPSTERRNVGTTLVITPTIHADRTATIRLAQEESAAGELREIYSFEGQSFKSQDITQRAVTTTVIAQDGQITAIGGLVRERVSDRRIGIPFLMDMPFLGAAFRTTIKARERHELLFLVRPFILLAPGEAEKVSQDFLERISLHPSTADDLPSLGVGADEFSRLAPESIQKTRNALDGIRRRARIWPMETHR
jgi:type II secretory pathway component GspD/PulD (secretin)